jgi:plasmid stability protein
MAQVTIYLPDGLARAAKQRAKRAGKSLSAFFADLLSRQLRPRRWPESFARLYGSCSLPEIDDAPVDEVDI